MRSSRRSFSHHQTMKRRRSMHRQQDFLFVVMLAAAAMTPAAGQDVTPAMRSGNGTQSTASVLDFSGVWSLPSLNALEPPLSGPGPVRNRSRVPTGPQAGVGDGRQLGRRLHQSDLAALGGGSLEEVRRDFLGRSGLSDPAQPVLARRSALRAYKSRNADAPAAGQNHDPLPLRSSIPPGADEQVASGATDAFLVWGFRRPL